MASLGFIQGMIAQTSALNFTWDIILVIILIGGSLAYSFLIGRKQIVTMLVSVYLALAVTLFFPFYENITGMTGISVSIVRISFFIGLTLITSLLIVRSKLRYLLDRHEKMKLGSTFIMSLIQIGLLITIILFLLPPEFSENLRVWTQFLFTTPLSRFVWMTLPILSLMIVKK